MIIMHRFFLGKFRINGFIIVFTFQWSIDVMVNMLGNIPFMISFMISKQADKVNNISNICICTVLPHLSGHHGTVHKLRCPDM